MSLEFCPKSGRYMKMIAMAKGESVFFSEVSLCISTILRGRPQAQEQLTNPNKLSDISVVLFFSFSFDLVLSVLLVFLFFFSTSYFCFYFVFLCRVVFLGGFVFASCLYSFLRRDFSKNINLGGQRRVRFWERLEYRKT